MSDALDNLLMVARTSLENRQKRILERQSLDKLLIRDAETVAERVAKAGTDAFGISSDGLCDETIKALVACESWEHIDEMLYFPQPKKKVPPVVDLTIKKRKKRSSKARMIERLNEKIDNEDDDAIIEMYQEQIRILEEESSSEGE